MINALNTSATGMEAQQKNIDVVANNLANMNTTAFKKSRAEFEDLLYQTIREPGAPTSLNTLHPTGIQTGVGVRTSSIQKEFTEGALKVTERALDMAIDGHGFFPILMTNGNVAYSRDGSFKTDGEGRVVTASGDPMIPEILIPPNALAMSVGADGTVTATLPNVMEPQVIGRVQLIKFINPSGLKSIGGNRYLATIASGNPMQGNPGDENFGIIRQGALETANVNSVEEMVNMISAQRAYEANSKVIQATDQMWQYTNNLR